MRVQNERAATGTSGDEPSGIASWRTSNSKSNIGSLRSQHRDWGLPSDTQIRWLLDQGVSVGTLEAAPCSMAATKVRFEGRFFIPDPDGENGLIFRATDRDEVIDLVGWSPRTDQLGSFLGLAFCLGDQDQLHNSASWFAGGGLNIYRSPLQWLRTNRRGIVIVDPRQTYGMLRHVPRLLVDNIAHGEQVKRWMQRPKLTTQILVSQKQETGSLSA
jgi:hypothetical protein